MWVELAPRPYDFCGCPPCPQCYRWTDGQDGPDMSGLEKLSLDLLQTQYADLPKSKQRELEAIAKKIHDDKVAAIDEEPETPPPTPEHIDIGMSPTLRIAAIVRQNRPPKASKPPPRQLNCDQIAERQAEREEKAAAETAEREKRLKEVREVAKVLAEVQKEAQPKDQTREERDRYKRGRDQLRGVDPEFIRYCEGRGIYDPEIIYAQARTQRALIRSDYDPYAGPSPFDGGPRFTTNGRFG